MRYLELRYLAVSGSAPKKSEKNPHFILFYFILFSLGIPELASNAMGGSLVDGKLRAPGRHEVWTDVKIVSCKNFHAETFVQGDVSYTFLC